jgi:hypothetical protein
MVNEKTNHYHQTLGIKNVVIKELYLFKVTLQLICNIRWPA